MLFTLVLCIFLVWCRQMVAQAMSLLHVHTTVVGVGALVSCATLVVKMAPPNISSTPPAEEATEMAASNATAAGATSNGGTAVSTLATAASAVGVIALAGALITFGLVPGKPSGNVNETTPRLSDPTILPKVPCPDSASAMFSGYKMSNTSENGQLLLVTLVDLPENLELFLTNSFGLPTASDDFFGNQTASAKV
jgi:hypothetical protein